jgi:hypothetical protein
MIIREIFKKDINRRINGVIKVDDTDEEIKKNELEEYVVTKELNENIGKFFDGYKNGIDKRTDSVGIWISGFFGSGKSHLLKILSYILGNKEVDEKKPVEYFKDKINDNILYAEMERISKKPVDVILFNLDAKANVNSKNEKMKIVEVFSKTFNAIRGLCSSQLWLSELEEWMIEKGKYEKFKYEIYKKTGKSWENIREYFDFEFSTIQKILSEILECSEEEIEKNIEYRRKDYELTVEKFAKNIKKYLDSKGSEHHILFMVDEVGQYISDDGQLMLNLQTVVEQLGTVCKGRAWVVVTSQQNLDDQIKNIKEQDFSKIQGRFTTRINLSSKNADEVIKIRILEKEDKASDILKEIYRSKEYEIKNKLNFTPDTVYKWTYSDEGNFSRIYPFIEYQFNLLQDVFQIIRIKSASGKHLSEGERSLLGAFHEVAKNNGENDLETFIPFSAFYETIDQYLDHDIKIIIDRVEKNREFDEIDLEVLKLLFLLKNVKNMPSNLDNISTLLIKRIDDNPIEIKKRVNESLEKLYKKNYIHKNGDIYIFLTNEEQEINREIKNTEVDEASIIQKISEIIYDDIFTKNRVNYNKIYNFDFIKRVDNHIRNNKKHEISMIVLTSKYDNSNLSIPFQFQNMASSENALIVDLTNETRIPDIVEEGLKIQKYLTKTAGTTLTKLAEEIRSAKNEEISQKNKEAKKGLNEVLLEADYYLPSEKYANGKGDLNIKITEALKKLVEKKYKYLSFIKKPFNDENEIKRVLNNNDQLSLIEKDPNKEAKDKINDLLEMKNELHDAITLQTIIEHFSKAPYGWRPLDIEGLIAVLLKESKIKLQFNSKIVLSNEKNTFDYLTKGKYFDNLIIKQRKEIDKNLLITGIRIAKEIFEKYPEEDEDVILKVFKDSSREVLYEGEENLKSLLEKHKEEYPGKEILEKYYKILEEIFEKSKEGSSNFFEYLNENEKEINQNFSNYKKVLSFLKNQKKYFDEGLENLKLYEGSHFYLTDPELIEVVDEIKRIVKLEEPYKEIHKLMQLNIKFKDKYHETLEKEKGKKISEIQSDKDEIKDFLSRYQLNDENKKEEIIREMEDKYAKIFENLQKENDLNSLSSKKEWSERTLEKIKEEIKKEKENERKRDIKIGPEIINFNIKSIISKYSKITEKEQINRMIQEIKTELESKLGTNTEIRLID